MKSTKILLLAALSFSATSGLMAKQESKDAIPGVAAQPVSFFYTGKPYDDDLDAYTFNYRDYDPAIGRWTSADPSGFPDGLNNRVYVANPVSQFDPFGLLTISNTSPSPATATYSADGVTYTVTANEITHINSTSFSTFKGWTFVNGGTLTGELDVSDYQAGFTTSSSGAHLGGAMINVGVSGQPEKTYDWIQWINSNAPISGESYPGFDVSQYNTDPFYAGIKTVGGDPSMYDYSSRNISNITPSLNPVTWTANLYLVSVDDIKKIITVYDGLSWSWTLAE